MLFESERRVMEVLWREGSLRAGEIAKILALEVGWSRNTTYTVINKCVSKGYIVRGEKNFFCEPILTKREAANEILYDVMDKYFDSSPVKLFSALSEKSGKQELKKMKKIIKNAE